MKVQIRPAVGAVLKVKTKDGKTYNNDQVESIELEPFFSIASGYGEVINASSSSAVRGEVDKCTIVAAGKTGKLTRRDVTEKSVVPAIDQPARSKPAPAAAPAKSGDGKQP